MSSADATAVGSAPVLSIRNLSKTFPGVLALNDVALDVRPGTVHALLGQNGCGKSTIIKVLAGFHRPDPGASASLNGSPYELGSAAGDLQHPIRFVHQDLGLINELDAIDNFSLALGYTRTASGRVDQRRESARATELMARFGLQLDLTRPIAEASAVERAVLAISRALAGLEPGEGMLVLDEPTASLPSVEVRRLFDAIREVRDSGTAVLYVSHRLDEIFEIADYVTVMRGGRIVDERPVADITPRALASLIAGQDTDQARRYQPTSTSTESSAVFQVRNLTSTSLFGVDLEVNSGEIVGVAGLLGSGRDELPYAAAGARRETTANWTVDSRQVDRLDVAQALKLGVALVPGDRGRESIVRDFTVLENLSLAMLPRLGTAASLNHRSERRQALEWMRRFDVDEGHIDRPIAVLSGGNQQKVVLARWLWSEPKVLILSEPTAGVDVGSRQSLYEILRAQAEAGLAVLVCSSDVEDLVAVSNRVLVLRDGRIVQELSGDQLTTGAIVSATEGADG